MPSRSRPGILERVPLGRATTVAADGSGLLPSATGALRGRTVRAVRYSLVAQIAVFSLSMASIYVLARWLTPDDFGLFALAYVTITWVSCFAESGLSYATVQRLEMSHGQASNLFWANALLGLLAAAATAVIGPAAAWTFGRPEISAMMPALGLGILVSCLGLQHLAMLQRRLDHGRIAVATVGSKAVGLLVAIGMAHHGAGPWALVGQEVAHSATRVLLLWTVCLWVPSLPRRGSGTLSLVKLGAAKSVADLLGVMRRSVDNILLGLSCGAETVGLYSRAAALVSTPLLQAVGPVTNVAVPALSRVQAEPERFRRAALHGLELIALVALPACVFVGVAADAIVGVMMGSGWEQATPLVQALTVRAVVACLFFPALAWGFAALGETKAQLRWSAWSLVVTVLIGLVGAQFGALGMAVSVGLAAVIVVPVGIATAFRGMELNTRAICLPMLPMVLGSMIAGTVAWGVMTSVRSLGDAWSLASGMVAFSGAYLGSFAVRRDGRARLRSLMSVAMGRA